jgi:hypothetical protein
MKLQRPIGRRLLVVAAMVMAMAAAHPATAATAAPAAPAGQAVPATITADSTSCSVGYLATSCKTGTIQSNRSAYYLYVRVCAAPNHYADWQVKDALNSDIVGQGRVAAGSCMGRIISDLYRVYWGWVFNTRRGASIYISKY